MGARRKLRGDSARKEGGEKELYELDIGIGVGIGIGIGYFRRLEFI